MFISYTSHGSVGYLNLLIFEYFMQLRKKADSKDIKILYPVCVGDKQINEENTKAPITVNFLSIPTPKGNLLDLTMELLPELLKGWFIVGNLEGFMFLQTMLYIRRRTRYRTIHPFHGRVGCEESVAIQFMLSEAISLIMKQEAEITD